MFKPNEIILLQKQPKLIQISFYVERSNTYVLCDRNHAIVVDVCSASIVDILKNRGIIPIICYLRMNIVTIYGG